MTINDVMFRLDIVKNILYKDGDNEINKELKIKLLNFRIKLSKIGKGVDEDSQEFIKSITPPELDWLITKPDKTIEDEQNIQKLNDKIREEYTDFLTLKGQEEVEVQDLILTEEEYQEIVNVNINHDIKLNNIPVNAQDFLATIYNLFVQ